MDCGSCGARNPRGNQFCVKCGARLAPQAAESSAPRTAPDAVRAQQLLEQAFRYSDQGLLDEAIEACRNATIANPTSTSAHSFLGILYERAGQREKAIREYELALSLSPESVADRESLQQLASETGAPAGIPKTSRRLARSALIAGFAAVALILGAAVVFTYNRSREAKATFETHYPYPAPAPAPVTVSSERETPTPPPSVAFPATGKAYPTLRSPLQPRQPTYTLTDPVPRALPQPKPARISLPTTGRVIQWQPPVALAAPAVRRPVGTAGMREAAGAAREPLVAAPQVARSYYFGRQYDEAIRVYQRMLRLRPDGDATMREELAWCYYQADRTRDAVAQYEQALGAYQRQLRGGVEPEQAELGMRTCRAAIEALSAPRSRQ